MFTPLLAILECGWRRRWGKGRQRGPSTMYVASIISVELATSTNMRHLPYFIPRGHAPAGSSWSAKERREQAAAAGGTTSSNSGSSKKSRLGSMGEFTTLSVKNPLSVSTNLILIDIKVSNFLLNFDDFFLDLLRTIISYHLHMAAGSSYFILGKRNMRTRIS
ncbi:hypothetical protein YC2023_054924 [Brassica napus]